MTFIKCSYMLYSPRCVTYVRSSTITPPGAHSPGVAAATTPAPYLPHAPYIRACVWLASSRGRDAVAVRDAGHHGALPQPLLLAAGVQVGGVGGQHVVGVHLGVCLCVCVCVREGEEGEA